MLFKTQSAAVYGIDASIIEVEVDVSAMRAEKDNFQTVGLPDAAVRESRDRVRSAIKNSGFLIPPTHITINLAPADLKKEGSGFDLPIAISGTYPDGSPVLWVPGPDGEPRSVASNVHEPDGIVIHRVNADGTLSEGSFQYGGGGSPFYIAFLHKIGRAHV